MISGFMIQGGDRLGTGTGGPATTSPTSSIRPAATRVPEFSQWPTPDRTRTAASSSSRSMPRRISITSHTVFGEVVEGLDIVKKIGNVPTGRQDKPVKPVVINHVTITRV